MAFPEGMIKERNKLLFHYSADGHVHHAFVTLEEGPVPDLVLHLVHLPVGGIVVASTRVPLVFVVDHQSPKARRRRLQSIPSQEREEREALAVVAVGR